MTAEIVARLSDKITDCLQDLLPVDTRFALLDYPDYRNVGDNAIYLGAIRFFERAGLCPNFACIPAKTDWDALAATIDSGPIFLSGGGNFGDLYDWAQDYREEVLRRFPGRPIIQLPQTVYFQSQARIDQAARAIERHGAFILCVRDEPSLALASRHFSCEVRLCPDMAFSLGPLPREASCHDLVLLLRTDEEAVSAITAGDMPPDAIIADWPDDPHGFHAHMRRSAFIPALLARALSGPWAARERVLRQCAEERVRRGASLLCTGKSVITDRLHGHILCLLLGIRHVFFDNNYGKIRAFSDTWATQCASAIAAPSMQAGLDVIARWDG